MSPVLLIACGVFGAVLCLGFLALRLSDRYQVELDSRFREIPKDSNPSRTAPRSLGALTPANPSSSAATGLLNRLTPNSASERKHHQARLMQAGIYSPSALTVFLAARLGLVVLPPLIGMLAGYFGWVDVRWGLVGGCVAGGIGMILPSFWLDRAVHRRHCLLRHSLPDFLDLMIICLKSGLSLQGAMQRVSDELRMAHPVFSGELNIVQRDIDLGATLEVALRRFANRSGYDGIRSLTTFVRESQRFGTELSEALRSHADMLRTQREQAAEEMAQKASVKILLPMLLLILPAVFVVVAGPAVMQIRTAFAKKN